MPSTKPRSTRALCEHLTRDECARLRREVIRYANQESTVLPEGFVQLVQVARPRGGVPTAETRFK